MDRREWLGDSQEAFRASFEGQQKELWTALPAIVVDVNLEKQTISAQGAIKGIITNKDGSKSYPDPPSPLFINVPICFPRGGGYAVTFPIRAGDEVLIVFSSRCIDGWWQSGGVQAPPSLRMHDLSDGFAIPGPTSIPNALSGVSSNSLRVMNEEATKYVEISESKITVESDGDVEVYGENVEVNATNNAAVSGVNINLTASAAVNITAPDIYLNGTVHP
jgi:hypothetical protein